MTSKPIKHVELTSTEALRKRLTSPETSWDEAQRLLAVLSERLPQGEVEKVLAYLSGYKAVPPTFREFCEEDDFGGKAFDIWPAWVDLFEEKLFPSRYGSPYSLVINQSAIGVGKSFSSSVAFQYEICKLMHIDDPHGRFGLSKATFLDAALYAPSVTLGASVLLDPIEMMMNENPFFSDDMEQAKKSGAKSKFTNNIHLKLMTRVQQSVGRAVFTFAADELNDAILHGQSEKIIRSLTRRMDSRFGNKDGTWPAGRAYLMSSARGNDATVSGIISSLPESTKKRTLFVQESQWAIKPEKFSTKTWPVFIGSETSDPFVYETKEDAANDHQNPEISTRIIEVPVNVLDHFHANCVEALQDIAGVTTLSSVMFFPSAEQLTQSMSWTNEISKVTINVGMDDVKNTQLISYINVKRLKLLVDGNPVFVHCDPALTGDLFGIALSFIDGWKTLDRFDPVTSETVKRSVPTVMTPLVFALKAKPGSEIPFALPEELIFDLQRQGFIIGKVSFDSFQSRQLQQRLTNGGVLAEVLSLDRTKVPFQDFRRVVSENRWIGPKCPALFKELIELQDTGKRIDHPNLGSKDRADAVCGSIFTALESVGLRSEAQATGEEFDILDSFIGETGGSNIKDRLQTQLMASSHLLSSSNLDDLDEILDIEDIEKSEMRSQGLLSDDDDQLDSFFDNL